MELRGGIRLLPRVGRRRAPLRRRPRLEDGRRRPPPARGGGRALEGQSDLRLGDVGHLPPREGTRGIATGAHVRLRHFVRRRWRGVGSGRGLDRSVRSREAHGASEHGVVGQAAVVDRGTGLVDGRRRRRSFRRGAVSSIGLHIHVADARGTRRRREVHRHERLAQLPQARIRRPRTRIPRVDAHPPRGGGGRAECRCDPARRGGVAGRAVRRDIPRGRVEVRAFERRRVGGRDDRFECGVLRGGGGEARGGHGRDESGEHVGDEDVEWYVRGGCGEGGLQSSFSEVW
mmetsp:Transcript_4278/g.8240  ORF Transcript_4278/g.8240 Transcript_4278/m.8240 type:complete len:288 (-) Transcript_4278:585-1448(-)